MTTAGGFSRYRKLFDDPRWAPALVRATVLEAAHPQVGAALIDNSTFVTHPWRRLRNTFHSMRRMCDADEAVRAREAARLNRLHARLKGECRDQRPYDAMDPAARAWVLATIFESAVTMYRLSGQPLAHEEIEGLYEETKGYLRALGEEDAHLPPTTGEFWPYYDATVERELEDTEAMRIILYKLFDHLPAPGVLSGLPTVWATGRAVAGPLIGAVTVASLPEPFRRRAGLPELPGVTTLMRGTYLAAGLTRFLPEDWISAESVVDVLSATPGGDDPASRTAAALHERLRRAGAFLRLLSPLPVPEPAASSVPVHSGAEEFFRDVLDQTGDGYLDWPDLAAMAREMATRLDLDEPEETRLYEAFAGWWRELQAALDTDGDGRVSAREYASNTAGLAGPALIRVAEVLFAATDRDGNGTIDAEEYRALFRTAFRRETADTGGAGGTKSASGADTYDGAAFVRAFVSFMSGRLRSSPFDPLLRQP
ncbi:oxygenase MpaB family protein [Streptomyces sp. NRRL F-5630]|uniref:oxygenase MpaB family protein n=1 Tax=Streptomyces sp. NRRL F-5630 TaxID=1463864 RepID=UPI0004CC0853|nr:oxygenase MpaB family protein [Streptomyces sp. NRRL F-5630]